MKIHIIEVDDWVAVYKDGKSVWQNHSCPLTEGLEALGIEFTREWFEDEEYDVDALTRPDGSDVFPAELADVSLSKNVETVGAPSEDELARLRESERELDALHAFGVDNWEGYGDAIRWLHTGEQDVW